MFSIGWTVAVLSSDLTSKESDSRWSGDPLHLAVKCSEP